VLRDNLLLLRAKPLPDRGEETDLDLDLDLVSSLRLLRRGGDGLREADGVLRRFGNGETDTEMSERLGDLRRVPRSGLLPRPLSPLPRYELRLPVDLDLRRRGAGERDLDSDLLRRRGGLRDGDLEREDTSDGDLYEGDLLRSSRLPPRPLGTYESHPLGRNTPRSLESRRGGGDLDLGPLRSKPLPPPRSKSLLSSPPRRSPSRRSFPRPP